MSSAIRHAEEYIDSCIAQMDGDPPTRHERAAAVAAVEKYTREVLQALSLKRHDK